MISKCKYLKNVLDEADLKKKILVLNILFLFVFFVLKTIDKKPYIDFNIVFQSTLDY